MRTRTTLAIGTLGAAALLPLGIGSASAADGGVNANLRPVALSGVNGSGTAMVAVHGTKITVTLAASGLLADSPHAAHIHFGADARHECPVAAEDSDKNGHLNTTEGAPAYGPVAVSLTKTGDTGPKSVLAIDRFSTAPGGKIAYQRGSITVTSALAQAIADGKGVIVVHGVDYNRDGKYDGKAKSDLNPALPSEATDPALCGALRAAPAGGMQTGAGGGAGGQNQDMLMLGGGALLAAAGTGAFAARRARVRA
jgi:hypothetical protein